MDSRATLWPGSFFVSKDTPTDEAAEEDRGDNPQYLTLAHDTQQAGAPIDAVSAFVETPLHLAVRNNRLGLVLVLVFLGLG